jgi:hypothetical protein
LEGIPVLDISVNPEIILSRVNFFQAGRNGDVVPNYIGSGLQGQAVSLPFFDILRSVWRLDGWKDSVSWVYDSVVSNFQQERWSLPFIGASYRKRKHIVAQLRVGYMESLYVCDHPCPLGVNDGLSIRESGSGNLFQFLGMFLHASSLYPNGNQGSDSDYDEQEIAAPLHPFAYSPRYRHGSWVGDVYGSVIAVAGIMLGLSLVAVVSWIFFDNTRSRLGWIPVALAAVILFLTIGTGFIGCLPWDWGRCLCDGEDHTENSQTDQHSNSIADKPDPKQPLLSLRMTPIPMTASLLCPMPCLILAQETPLQSGLRDRADSSYIRIWL